MNNDYWQMYTKSILAGFAISVAAYGFASLHGGIVGAILFGFGLLTVVCYGLPLFTGKAGFVQDGYDTEDLFAILFCNVIGCFIVSLIFIGANGREQAEFIQQAVLLRTAQDYTDVLTIFCKGIGCGFIMTTAVKFAQKSIEEKNMVYILPLLLGVPLFLVSGFFHSIVDAFYLSYYFVSPYIEIGSTDSIINSLVSWLIIVAGNMLGCNLQRLIVIDKEF